MTEITQRTLISAKFFSTMKITNRQRIVSRRSPKIQGLKIALKQLKYLRK